MVIIIATGAYIFRDQEHKGDSFNYQKITFVLLTTLQTHPTLALGNMVRDILRL